MDDRSRIVLSAVLGALAGGVAGYLFLTEDGRRVRERLAPAMDDVVREVRGLRGALDSARVATREGMAAIEDLKRGFTGSTEAYVNEVRPPRPY